MHLAKAFNNNAPPKVVNITITAVIVIMKSLCFVYICKHNANAITPLTIPEYQHIFNSFEFKGNGFFLLHLFIMGKTYTMIALTKGKHNSTVHDIPTAIHSVEMLNIEAPKYAKMNPSAI